MEDRYLFRGYSPIEKKWFYGLPRYSENGEPLYIEVLSQKPYCQDNGLMLYEIYEYNIIDLETLGQCTGLKDKNGKLIFEGDIVTLKDYHGKRTVLVGAGNGSFYYGGDGFSDEFIYNAQNVEVIGNIHDNPELLEAEE